MAAGFPLRVFVYPCEHTSQCQPAFVRSAPACARGILSSVFAAPLNPLHPLDLKAACVTFHEISQPANDLVNWQGQDTSPFHVIDTPIKIAYS